MKTQYRYVPHNTLTLVTKIIRNTKQTVKNKKNLITETRWRVMRELQKQIPDTRTTFFIQNAT